MVLLRMAKDDIIALATPIDEMYASGRGIDGEAKRTSSHMSGHVATRKTDGVPMLVRGFRREDATELELDHSRKIHGVPMLARRARPLRTWAHGIVPTNPPSLDVPDRGARQTSSAW
ncbi:MAG: hypothetical protein QM784_21360 [Polyangiaceae bacterium]